MKIREKKDVRLELEVVVHPFLFQDLERINKNRKLKLYKMENTFFFRKYG